MPSILNTIRKILMRLYISVEEIVTMCSVKKKHGGSQVHTWQPPDELFPLDDLRCNVVSAA